MIYDLVRPLLFLSDPESAHGYSLAALRCLPVAATPQISARLKQTISGLHFPNPVGLAPGYDKNAEIFRKMHALGFGFAEIGTVTPRPQTGNPRPRLFRLVEDRAVINRMGFNNDGMEVVAKRIQGNLASRSIPLGINIGANKDSEDRIADYVMAMQKLAPLADYITINISSPNTPGLRALQDKGALDDLLVRVRAAAPEGPPLFLKVAPDLETVDIDDIAAIAIERKLDALIVSNTTITRPTLQSRYAGEGGGLSGAPLRDLAHQRLIDFRKATGGKVRLIGVGGIASAEDAYARIRAGASLVQIYSALVYEGPFLAEKITRGLEALLDRDGFASITEAIGIDVD
ncbi:quinone-dependent dihydroorotate dehydrogenase [Sphingorhabdus sp.]|jgi:dihydroorotate dehydrogenase|uniref:quinone-dependent dihydroorotate dehydrogenase n=1 Tax=Sphingorhabdus sp. TaxID=1902408 RepID=UPI003BB108BA|nr:quinone-dependent dihydroorotate dehydrogenase [Sphingomonadales bacterium]